MSLGKELCTLQSSEPNILKIRYFYFARRPQPPATKEDLLEFFIFLKFASFVLPQHHHHRRRRQPSSYILPNPNEHT